MPSEWATAEEKWVIGTSAILGSDWPEWGDSNGSSGSNFD
jgi:hypothetical protein